MLWSCDADRHQWKCVCARCVLVPAQPAAPAAAPRVVSATANVWESNATDYRRLCTGGPPVDTDRQTLWKRLASLYPGLSLPSRWSPQWKVLVVAVAAATDVFIRSPQLSLTLANLASSLSGDCLSYCFSTVSASPALNWLHHYLLLSIWSSCHRGNLVIVIFSAWVIAPCHAIHNLTAKLGMLATKWHANQLYCSAHHVNVM